MQAHSHHGRHDNYHDTVISLYSRLLVDDLPIDAAVQCLDDDSNKRTRLQGPVWGGFALMFTQGGGVIVRQCVTHPQGGALRHVQGGRRGDEWVTVRHALSGVTLCHVQAGG